MSALGPLPSFHPPAPIGAPLGKRIGDDLVADMMDMLPSVYFCVKDPALRFIRANRAMAEACGVHNLAALHGRRLQDFFPFDTIAEQENFDRQVLEIGRSVRGKLCQLPRAGTEPLWSLYSSWPMLDQHGAVSGVAALFRGLAASPQKNATYRRLKLALDYIDSHFSGPIEVGHVAKRVGVSLSQLERDFSELLGAPPRRYITKVRLEAASEMLRGGGAIADIAHACGFSDQSAFTRRFRAETGLSPSAFRRANAVR